MIEEWLNLIVRWAHLVAGVAWIGTSFYFVALDLSLRKHAGLPPGVAGEAWEVHGGGFYHVRKYLSAPAELPGHLIWFKWEAYLTWVTGMALMVLLYYWQAQSYLIDPTIMPLTTLQAVGISLASLLIGWLIYTALCKSPLGQRTSVLAVSVFLLILLAAYFYTHVFSGRGAFIHVGAFAGTIMAANVFMVIIPNQRKITKSLIAGEVPDPKYGATGKQRSLHNTYLTLPVLLMMVSNHYAFLTGHPQAWILIGLIVVSGGMIRHYLLRTEIGDDQSELAWLLPLIAGALAIALYITAPTKQDFSNIVVSDEQALAISQAHCASCHALKPLNPTIKSAPKGVVLETLDDLRRHKAQIMVQAVQSRAMPMGNQTKMTDEDRARLGAWLAQLK